MVVATMPQSKNNEGSFGFAGWVGRLFGRPTQSRAINERLAAPAPRVPVSSEPGGPGMPPPLAEPRIKRTPGGQAYPSFMTRASPGRSQNLAKNDRRLATTDMLSMRAARDTKTLVRDLTAASPDMSAAVNAYIRLVVTKDYRAIARNQDGTPNPQATKALQVLLTRFDYMAGYHDGFSGVGSIHAVAESMVRELRIDGSCAMELVLDRARMPERLQPIASSQITFVDDGRTKYPRPVQVIGGEEIDLDYPTFFYEALDQDLLQAYSDSPMESAVQATLQDAEFTNDVRRIIKRALHPRLTATIDSEEFVKSLPSEISSDPEKLRDFRNQLIASLQNELNGLEPDDVLVAFDTIKFNLMGRGNESLGREYQTLQEITDSKVASGTKAPGSVLGHAKGSQNIASTESMLFVKYCQGVQIKVNSIFSRALTLGVRLLGHDCYVDFQFDRIDLRPDSELEAFNSMRQSRLLELLSLGMISDEDAAIELIGRLPPDGAPKLSGTFFKMSPAQAADNPYSNTSALNQDLKPDSPQQPKGAALRAV